MTGNKSPLAMVEFDVSSCGMSQEDDIVTLQRDEVNIPKRLFSRIKSYRDLICFWIFGLGNNFAYVVMLSAAHDILYVIENDGNGNESYSWSSSNDSWNYAKHAGNNTAGNLSVTTANSSESDLLICNTLSTGSILLADILPTLLVKLTFPLFIQKIPYVVKVTLVSSSAAVSFVVVAFSKNVWQSIAGVACASFSAGLGEISFLSLTTFYRPGVVSSWSSGTGGAGVVGALVYAGFTALGLSPRTSLLVMTIVPFIMMIFYIFVLPPADLGVTRKGEYAEVKLCPEKDREPLSFKEKLRIIPTLFKYMIPLFLIFYAAYFINQGLLELLYFNNEFLSREGQYRWYQVVYQIGVFISRSSVTLFQIRKIWILPVLQLVNLAVLIAQVYYRFVPSLWLVIGIVLWEGLLGGAAYVNTFYRMTKDLPDHLKEFCFGITPLGDSSGIAAAGATAIPFHNYVCSLKLKV